MPEALGTFSEPLTVRVAPRGRGSWPASLVSTIPRAPGTCPVALPAPGGAVPVHTGAFEDLSVLSREGTVSAGQPGARDLCLLPLCTAARAFLNYACWVSVPSRGLRSEDDQSRAAS